jgi:tetratricopeptide (TPR) repeat protein
MKHGLTAAGAALILISISSLPTGAQTNAPQSTTAPAVAAPTSSPDAGPYADLVARSNALTQAERDQAKGLIAMGVELVTAGKDCTSALKALKQGLDIDPADPTGNYYFGACTLVQQTPGSTITAFDYLTRAATLGGSAKETFQAQTKLAEFDDNIRAQLVQGELAKANAAFNAGNHNEAVTHCNLALLVQPNNADAIGLRDKARQTKSDLERTASAASQALQANSDDPEAYLKRGNAYFQQGNYDAAIADYDKAIQLRPDFAAAFTSRGASYARKLDYDRALGDYDKLVQLRPNDANAYLRRGATYATKKDFDHALADLDKTIQLDANNAENFYARGMVYRDKKDYGRACADFDKAIALKPDYTDAIYNRGLTNYDRENYSDSIKDFTRYIELKPNDPQAYYQRGNAHHDGGLKNFFPKSEMEAAIRDYTRAIELKPNFPQAYRGRGLSFLMSEDYYGALSDCNYALKLDPNYEPAKKCVSSAAYFIDANSGDEE